LFWAESEKKNKQNARYSAAIRDMSAAVGGKNNMIVELWTRDRVIPVRRERHDRLRKGD
jgi:hypothetical protein